MDQNDPNFEKCTSCSLGHTKKAHTAKVGGQIVNTACNYAGCGCRAFKGSQG